MILCIAGSCGIYFYEVITDPVDLWSSPTSQAREEKNYFDENFGPFFRTAQIMVKPNPDKFKPFTQMIYPSAYNERSRVCIAVRQLD